MNDYTLILVRAMREHGLPYLLRVLAGILDQQASPLAYNNALLLRALAEAIANNGTLFNEQKDPSHTPA